MIYRIKVLQPNGEEAEVLGDIHLSLVSERFRLQTVECCGWLNLSNFSYYQSNETKLELFRFINEDMTVRFPFPDSKTQNNPSQFTLFCVLTSQQEVIWEPHLLKYGWRKVCSFFNPNTDNMCHQWVKTRNEDGYDGESEKQEDG